MKWISVKDKLPNYQEDVLTITGTRNVFENRYNIVCYYDVDNCGWFKDGENIHNVTHWMPLPEPPKRF